MEITHYAWIFCKSFKKWRNTPEETSFPLQGKTRSGRELSGSDLDPSEVQRRLYLWASNPHCLPALVSVHRLASWFSSWQLSHLKSSSALSVQWGFFWPGLLDAVFLSDSDGRSTGCVFNKAHSTPTAYFFPFVLYLPWQTLWHLISLKIRNVFWIRDFCFIKPRRKC